MALKDLYTGRQRGSVGKKNGLQEAQNIEGCKRKYWRTKNPVGLTHRSEDGMETEEEKPGG